MHIFKKMVVACVSSVRISKVLCGVCRRAKLIPFEETLSKLALGHLPKEDGSLPPSINTFWCLWEKRSFPSLAGVAMRLLCMHSAACANWSACGLM